MDIARVQAFFFKAMVEGYAAQGSKKTKVADMPGYKEIRFQDGDFLLVDRWCVNRLTEKSVGTTTIWFENEPVWVMHYGGVYAESAVAMLKRALAKSYGSYSFVGGRGPRVYVEGTEKMFAYVNHPRLNDFSKFEGREEIRAVENDGEQFGFHEYWGMSLL